MAMEHTISNSTIKVIASELGAELHSIKHTDGIEFLWQGAHGIWEGHAPNLFPYIARLTNGRYSYKGKYYELPIHGFAPTSRFELKTKSEACMIFSLASDSETRRHYPFDFIYEVKYEICGNVLVQTYTVINLNKEIMYFAVGAHPGFNVPLYTSECFEDYFIEFEGSCQPIRIGFSEDCFLNQRDTPFILDENKKLFLSHNLFDDDAIVLKDMAKRMTLKSRYGHHSITVQYPDMRYLGLWHRPHTTANYICIEPWSSLPSRKDIIEDLEQQENLLSLPGWETFITTITYEFD